MTTLDTRRSQAYTDDRAHVFHSWSAQGALTPLVVAGGRGRRGSGTRTATATSTSRPSSSTSTSATSTPSWSRPSRSRPSRLCTIAPFHANDARSEAARLIAELAPGDLDMVFFTNGGAEATENAMRMARLHTGRHKVLTTYRSYHGATDGSITLTGDPRRWPSEPGHARRRPLLGPVPVPLAVPRHHRGRGVRAGAAAPRRHDHGRGRRTPSPPSSSRRWWAPTASSCRPTATSPASASCATGTAS